MGEMRQMPAAEHLLTPREVAARLSLSVSSVQRLAREGRLPAYRLGPPGASLRFDEGEVERWLHAPEDGAA
jgi:excisionase family DNA binding protein